MIVFSNWICEYSSCMVLLRSALHYLSQCKQFISIQEVMFDRFYIIREPHETGSAIIIKRNSTLNNDLYPRAVFEIQQNCSAYYWLVALPTIVKPCPTAAGIVPWNSNKLYYIPGISMFLCYVMWYFAIWKVSKEIIF